MTNDYEMMLTQKMMVEQLQEINSKLDLIFKFHDSIKISQNEAAKILSASFRTIQNYEKEGLLTNESGKEERRKEFSLKSVFDIYYIRNLKKGKVK